MVISVISVSAESDMGLRLDLVYLMTEELVDCVYRRLLSIAASHISRDELPIQNSTHERPLNDIRTHCCV